jgi:uncharacterized membrane protein (UPF0182 family)
MVGYNREFLAAHISVDSDPDNYGRITVLQLPTDTLTQGPQQIQNSDLTPGSPLNAPCWNDPTASSTATC